MHVISRHSPLPIPPQLVRLVSQMAVPPVTSPAPAGDALHLTSLPASATVPALAPPGPEPLIRLGESLLAKATWSAMDERQARETVRHLGRVLATDPAVANDMRGQIQGRRVRWQLVMRLGMQDQLSAPRVSLAGTSAEMAARLETRYGLTISLDPSSRDYAALALQHMAAALEHMPAGIRQGLRGTTVSIGEGRGGTMYSGSQDTVTLAGSIFLFPRTPADVARGGGHMANSTLDIQHVPIPELVVAHELFHAWHFKRGEAFKASWRELTGWADAPPGESQDDRLRDAEDRWREDFPTTYAATNQYEDFADAAVYYHYAPSILQLRSPERYAFLADLWGESATRLGQ